MIRDRALRIAAIGLVLYGLLGFVLIGLGYVIARQTFAEVDALRSSIGDQRGGLVATRRSSSQTLGDAARAFDRFGESTSQARRSAQQSAGLARDSAETMSALAAAMAVQVLGAQPLLPLADGFSRASQQLESLGDTLEALSSNLGRNEDDVEQAGRDLAALQRQVDELARAFEATPLPGGSSASLVPLWLAIYGLLVWLAGQAALSVLLGVVLYRFASARRRAVASLAPAPSERAADRADRLPGSATAGRRAGPTEPGQPP